MHPMLSVINAVILVLLLLLTVFVWLTIKIHRIHAKYAHIPGPRRVSFFFGNLPEVNATIARGDELTTLPKDGSKMKPCFEELLAKWADIYGDIFVIFMMHEPLVVVRGAEAIQTVLMNENHIYEQAHLFNFKELFGTMLTPNSLFTTVKYEPWSARRRFLDPLFHRAQLYRSLDSINLTAEKLVDDLATFAETGESFQLGPMFHRFTLHTILRRLYSIDPDTSEEDFDEMCYNFSRNALAAFKYTKIPFFEWNPMNWKYIEKTKEMVVRMRQTCGRYLRERMEQIQAGEDVPDDLLTACATEYLSGSTKVFRDIEAVIDDVVNFVPAGMDTTANILEFIMMELGRRPDLRKRLIEEIDEAVGKKVDITSTDIGKFPFMNHVIKETVRLHPQAPVLRRPSTDTMLGRIPLPKGTTVMVNILAANRNKAVIEDADEFNPDRFDENKSAKSVPTYSNIPFSLGHRNCIGQVLAQMEMKVMLAKFFQNYDFHIDPSETYQSAVELFPAPISQVKCTITPRM